MDLLFEGAARMCYRIVLSVERLRQKDSDRLRYAPGHGQENVTTAHFLLMLMDVDALLITHAHMDHTGLIPLIINQGFKGKIYATTATRDLNAIMLEDSGHIQQMEAEWKTRKATRAGHPAALPLYTAEQGRQAAQGIITVEYGETFELFPGIAVNYLDAGHLLGSAMIKFWIKEADTEKQLVFSGDIGNLDRPILRDPSEIKTADYVVMESTYGNRLHPPRSDQKKAIADIIKQTFDKGGNVVYPFLFGGPHAGTAL